MDNEILEMAYEQWRQHPVTVLLDRALRNHRDTQLAMAIGHSTSGEVKDEQLRRHLISAKNTEAIIALVNDKTILDRVANPPKEKAN